MPHEQLNTHQPPDAHLRHEWQLYESVEAGADLCLLHILESPSLAVVLGRNTFSEQHVVQEACRADGIPILTRHTGGGAVVLGPGCLNYAVVLPLVSHPGLTDVALSFRIVLGWMVEALGVHGLTVAGGADIALDGLKVSGNAQRRGRRALLHHGTLLYDFDGRPVTRYLREPGRQPAYRNRRPHTAFMGNLPLTRAHLLQRLGQLGRLAESPLHAPVGMADEPIAGGHGAEHGAQEVTAGEREARKQAERRQDLQEPAEGRDVPPAEDVKKGPRSSHSPWMGGG
jgi:lipoate-protein ligase A